MGRWVRWVLIFLVLLALIAAVLGWMAWRRINGPGTAFTEESRVLLIPSSATYEQVVDSLRAEGAFRDEELFRLVAERKKYPSRVKSGRYRIVRGTSLNDLVDMLRSGQQEPVRVTFTNIEDLPELAGRVAQYLEPDSLAMLELLADTTLMRSLGHSPETFIGMFIPDTYEFWWNTTPAKFVERMRKEHEAFWTVSRLAKADAIGLKPGKVATLASIVQAETVKPDESPRIAGVYLNRLRIGMPLQADPTLKFALGDRAIRRLLNVDKQIDSPYNTYLYTGLPPGPINMPERRFIDAVLDAERHEFLYFCAREDLSGYSNFARTYDQHLVNARRYQRALDQQGIMR
ncbi:MAG: endolytic transglycosylase MltG [Flavobacteriales bacterium]|nr:endolytic transglycosylase MltG [Flavobacteriales bacterium]